MSRAFYKFREINIHDLITRLFIEIKHFPNIDTYLQNSNALQNIVLSFPKIAKLKRKKMTRSKREKFYDTKRRMLYFDSSDR